MVLLDYEYPLWPVEDPDAFSGNDEGISSAGFRVEPGMTKVWSILDFPVLFSGNDRGANHRKAVMVLKNLAEPIPDQTADRRQTPIHPVCRPAAPTASHAGFVAWTAGCQRGWR